MDIVQEVHGYILQRDGGQCPLSPWKLSSMSGLSGLCLKYPWTLSRLNTKSMDIVQADNGECLLC